MALTTTNSNIASITADHPMNEYRYNNNFIGSNAIGSYGWTTVSGTTCFSTTANVSLPVYGATGVYNPNQNTDLHKELDELKNLFFMKVVVPCAHWGQYGAAGCACKHCGAPIDYGKLKPEKELNSLLQNEIQRTQRI